jgi:hypothetical protein
VVVTWWRRPWVFRLAVVLGEGLLVAVMYHQWGWHPTHTIIASASADHVQQTWFLAWYAHALGHGLNPLWSPALNAPGGINLVTNTSAPLLSVLAAPVTWWFGPLTSYLWLLAAGLWFSAVTYTYAARRLGLSRGGAVVAGLIYGFAARRFVRGDIHVFLTFEALVPLFLLALVLGLQGRLAPRRAGLLAGGILAANVWISLETSFVVALAAVLGTVGALVWRIAPDLAPRLRAMLRWGAPLFVVVVSPALWWYFVEPGHVTSAPHTWVMAYAASLGSLWRPGPYAWLAPFGHQLPGALFHGSDPWTNPNYLGPALIGGVLAAWWTFRRTRLTHVLAAIAMLGLLLSFGLRLHLPLVGAVPMPMAILRHLPFFRSTQPLRFELWTSYIAAFAVGALIDTWWQRRTPSGRVAAVTLAAAVLVSLVPATTYAVAPVTTESWFSSTALQRAIPSDAITLTYPYSADIWNMTMLDQAEAGVWYRLVGGQAIVPGPDGRNQGIVPVGSPRVFAALWRSFSGQLTGRVTGFRFPVADLPPDDAATAAAFRQLATQQGVRAVIWRAQGVDPLRALAYLRRAFGPGHMVDHGAIVWWRLDRTGAAVSDTGR